MSTAPMPLSTTDAEIVASLDALTQPFALAHRDNCMRRGLPYYFTSGARSKDFQRMLREKLGSGAAKPGNSKHEVGAAWDANNAASAPMSDAQWQIFGEEAEKLGLVWGGRFASRDLGHVELPQSRSEIAAYRNMKLAAVGIMTVGVAIIATSKK